VLADLAPKPDEREAGGREVGLGADTASGGCPWSGFSDCVVTDESLPENMTT
jgi:hypothetical protein